MKMFKKLQNKKGFTLMEMLIVVAIMVILVAVSIPVFTSQMNNAKTATDQANERAAKSVITTAYMTGGGSGSITTIATGTDYYYDAANGYLTTTEPDGYGKGGTALDGSTTVPVDGVVKVSISDAGVVTTSWE